MPVVERRSDAAEVVEDLPAVLVQPFPDALDELLAAELLARRSFGEQRLLDDILRRDPGVVEARLEERVVALHALPAHERVADGQIERVASVQAARDGGRRVAVDEGLARRVRLRVVEAFRFPRLLPALLDAVRLVPRLHGAIPAHLKSASGAGQAGAFALWSPPSSLRRQGGHPTARWGLRRNYAGKYAEDARVAHVPDRAAVRPPARLRALGEIVGVRGRGLRRRRTALLDDALVPDLANPDARAAADRRARVGRRCRRLPLHARGGCGDLGPAPMVPSTCCARARNSPPRSSSSSRRSRSRRSRRSSSTSRRRSPASRAGSPLRATRRLRARRR